MTMSTNHVVIYVAIATRCQPIPVSVVDHSVRFHFGAGRVWVGGQVPVNHFFVFSS